MNQKITLYHGSEQIIESPTFTSLDKGTQPFVVCDG